MSYQRIIKAQNGLQLVTEAGNMDLNPAGTLSLKGYVKGTDIAVHNADVATIGSLSPGPSEDGKVLSWNNTGSTYELVADSSNSYTAGDGLDVAANEFSLSASVAGDGLAHASGVLSVGVDDSTVELNSDALRVKDAGITAAKLAGDCIDQSKIADNAVQPEHLQANAVETAAIADANVTAAKLAGDCIDQSKIADAAVQVEHYQDGSITTAKLNASVLTNPSFALSTTMASANANATSSAFAFYQATTDATETAVAVGSLADDKVYLFDCYVAARDQTSGDAACYKAQFAASAASGSASIHGATNVEVVYEAAGASAWAVDFDNDGSDGIECNVTGDASNAVHWNVTLTRLRVA